MESTPASSPSAAPASAPASSAPVSSGSPSSVSAPATAPASATSRPATFEEAFAPPTADPTATPPASDEAAPATTAPDAPVEAPAPPPTDEKPLPGFMPVAEHKKVLDNARKKTETATLEAVAEVVRPYAEFAQRMQADPVATVQQLVTELADHPTYGPQMRSVAARMLGKRVAPAEDVAPEPDVIHKDTGAAYYSPEQAAKLAAWQARQAAKEAAEPLQAQLQPLLQDREQQAKQRQQQQFVQREAARAKTVVETMRTRPFFREHESAIKARMSADPALTVQEAYALVVAEQVVPTLQQRTQQSLVATATAKAAGSTSGPGHAPARPTRPRTFEEAFAQNPVG